MRKINCLAQCYCLFWRLLASLRILYADSFVTIRFVKLIASRSANRLRVLTSAPIRLRNAFSLSAQLIATTRKPHPTNVLLAKRNANHSFVSIAASRLSATFYAKRFRVVGTARSLKKENAKRRPVCGSVKGLSVKNLTVQKLESRA